MVGIVLRGDVRHPARGGRLNHARPVDNRSPGFHPSGFHVAYAMINLPPLSASIHRISDLKEIALAR